MPRDYKPVEVERFTLGLPEALPGALSTTIPPIPNSPIPTRKRRKRNSGFQCKTIRPSTVQGVLSLL